MFFFQHAEGTSGPSHTTQRNAAQRHRPAGKKGGEGFYNQFWDFPKLLFTVKNNQNKTKEKSTA